jgi:hypothetical protein
MGARTSIPNGATSVRTGRADEHSYDTHAHLFVPEHFLMVKQAQHNPLDAVSDTINQVLDCGGSNRARREHHHDRSPASRDMMAIRPVPPACLPPQAPAPPPRVNSHLQNAGSSSLDRWSSAATLAHRPPEPPSTPPLNSSSLPNTRSSSQSTTPRSGFRPVKPMPVSPATHAAPITPRGE